MKIKIIAEAIDTPDYIEKVGWGISLLVDNDLLFDTFGSGKYIEKIFKEQGLSFGNLKYVVISHDDNDHIDGLWTVLEKNPKLKVFLCKNTKDSVKNRISQYGAELVEVEKPLEIKKNIFTSGEISGVFKGKNVIEQALVIENKGSLSVITGCAHPGILKMLKHIRKDFKKDIKMIAGGIHLCDTAEPEIRKVIEEIQGMGIEKMAPFHCSGKKTYELLKEKYPDLYIPVKEGDVLNLE